MKRYFYFYLSGLNGLPDLFANVGFIEKANGTENPVVANTKRFDKLCELNHVTNRDLYSLTLTVMEF